MHIKRKDSKSKPLGIIIYQTGILNKKAGDNFELMADLGHPEEKFHDRTFKANELTKSALKKTEYQKMLKQQNVTIKRLFFPLSFFHTSA